MRNDGANLREVKNLIHDNEPALTRKIARTTVNDAGFYFAESSSPFSWFGSHRLLYVFQFEKAFGSDEKVIACVEEFLDEKDQSFFAAGIDALPDRWRSEIGEQGAYIK